MAAPEIAVQEQISPAAKHRKSAFGFEPSYEKRWDSVIQLQVLQQKTPHRYQQSPVFSRKALSSPPEEQTHKHHHHHHHHHHRHHKYSPRSHRRRGNSEGDKLSMLHSSSASPTSSDERVHLLSAVPWRKSDSESSSSNESLNDTPQLHPAGKSSSTLSKRFGHHPETREVHRHSPCASPAPMRKVRPRTRSQGMSPLPRRKLDVNANETAPDMSKIEYRGHMVIDIRPIAALEEKDETNGNDGPTTPATPLVDANGFLQLPGASDSDECLPPPPSPHTLRRLLGIKDDLNTEQGMTEEEILKSRLFARRFSSSSESSTSTLT